jgi:hypothetical protein
MLCVSCVRDGRGTGSCVAAGLMGVLVVGRGRWLLEGVAVPVPYAAVYHTGKMHGHGEGRGHGARQRLRNNRARTGGWQRMRRTSDDETEECIRDLELGTWDVGCGTWEQVVWRPVLADATSQNFGPVVLKYNGARIGEIQHEARSHCSGAGAGPRWANRCQRGGSDSGRWGPQQPVVPCPSWRTRRRDVVTARHPGQLVERSMPCNATAMQVMDQHGLGPRCARPSLCFGRVMRLRTPA